MLPKTGLSPVVTGGPLGIKRDGAIILKEFDYNLVIKFE
jgi:hypothetical protein